MLKELFKSVRQEKARKEKINGDRNFPALSIELFDCGKVHELSKEELRGLLQEAIYLLIDYSKNAEVELMQMVEEWHEDLFEEE